MLDRIPRCRGRHRILIAEESNAMGAFVVCPICDDSFLISYETLSAHYYHAHHPSPQGDKGDMDIFIIEGLLDPYVKGWRQ